MFGYLIEIQNQGLESYDDFSCLQEGDVVAFKTRDFLHHHYHHPFTNGLVEKVYTDPIDKLIRTVDISYTARPGEKVFVNEEMTILKAGLHCTTTRPVKTLIKICGKDDMEKMFELDVKRTETWLNHYHTQPLAYEIRSGTPPLEPQATPQPDQPMVKERNDNTLEPVEVGTWRPNQLICSKLPTQCITKLMAIQDELIEQDEEKSRFRVRSEKLHITHLVLSETENSKRTFDATSNKILKEKLPTNFRLGPLVDYNGNICLKLRSTELQAIQNLYKSDFDLQGITYDNRQSYHVTIFKKDYKLNYEPNLTHLDEELIQVDDTKYHLNSIDLCRMGRTKQYFPVEASYNINHEPPYQQDPDETKLQYTPPQLQPKMNDLEEKISPVANDVVVANWHGYNTRQMTRAKNAAILLCLYYLTQNLAQAEPGTSENPQLKLNTPDGVTSEEDQARMSTPPASSNIPWTLPIITILLVLCIVLLEVMYALYTIFKRPEIKIAAGIKGKAGDQSNPTKGSFNEDTMPIRGMTQRYPDIGGRVLYQNVKTPQAELNKTILNTIYRFHQPSRLEEFLTMKTGTKKDCYTLVELLTTVRNIVRDENMFDANNPEIILCSPELEKAWDMKALHISSIRNLVLSHVTKAVNQHPEEKPKGFASTKSTGGDYPSMESSSPKGSPLITPRTIESASITKIITTCRHARFTPTPKLLKVIQFMPGTPASKTIFTYGEVMNALSQYIHLKGRSILDDRNASIALVHGDLLGSALGVKAFSRCQINRLVRAQLCPVVGTLNPDEVTIINNSSHNVSVAMHGPLDTKYTEKGGSNTPEPTTNGKATQGTQEYD